MSWRAAMEAVPRRTFLPDVVYVADESLDGPDLVPVLRMTDPAAWLRLADADEPVLTQVDGGRPGPDGRGTEATSSASMPTVVADMLVASGAEPGDTVLEIGTGTGWSSALLAHRLGADHVVTVEIDADLATKARSRLDAAGYSAVEVVTGDGALGHPMRAPYDRVLATVAARQIPYPWVAQTRPGGTVVLPWGSEWWPSALLRLTAGTDGTATGRIVGPACFMLLRDQPEPRTGTAALLADRHQLIRSSTDLYPWPLTQPDAATAIGIRVPHCRQAYRDDGPVGARLTLTDRTSRSWALLYLDDGPPYRVEQHGPRALWDEVESAYGWWRDNGEPAVGDWLVTVGPDGQDVRLG